MHVLACGKINTKWVHYTYPIVMQGTFKRFLDISAAVRYLCYFCIRSRRCLAGFKLTKRAFHSYSIQLLTA